MNGICRLVIMVVLATMSLACATPMTFTDRPMTSADRDTEYAIDDRDDGFVITVNYSRYQFIPESSAVATACKSALTSLAFENADRKKQKIEPVNDQRIRISMGRNGFTGITSCSAQATVLWQK